MAATPKKNGKAESAKEAEATRKREIKRAKLAAAKKEGEAIAKRNEERGVGRPVDYDPAFCDVVIEMASEGASFCEIAAHIGVVRETLWAWANDHTEFSNARARGKELCQAWWERQGRKNLVDSFHDGSGSKFNDRMWTTNVKCRFRDDWHEKKDDDGTEAVKRLAEIAAILTSGKRPE